MDVDGWEDLAQDRPRWRQELAHSLSRGEKKLRLASEEQRTRHKNSQQAPLHPSNAATVEGTVAPGSPGSTVGAVPAPTNRTSSRRRSMIIRDQSMPPIQF